MRLKTVEKIYRQRPKNCRILGVDFGLKRIGLAISNPGQDTASPAGTIKRQNFKLDMDDFTAIVRDYEACGFVFGWPLNMDGTQGAMCERVRSFIDELVKYPDIIGNSPWIAIFDERLSTQSVEDYLVKNVDMSRTKRKRVIDKLAAQKILQSALDRMQQLDAHQA